MEATKERVGAVEFEVGEKRRSSRGEEDGGSNEWLAEGEREGRWDGDGRGNGSGNGEERRGGRSHGGGRGGEREEGGAFRPLLWRTGD